MKNIIRTLVACGVIGEYNIPWDVFRLHDIKNDGTCYDLFIDGEHIKTCESAKEAVEVLIDHFS